MGFDQYHEPPEELPAATRTFARLCASLTEEAEAIGWYEQRIAVETRSGGRWRSCATRRARSSSTSAWTSSSCCGARPRWREIAQGVLFQPGDIVEHGEEAEAEALEDGPRAGRRDRRRVARDRQPEGGEPMNHLLRSLAPISDSALEDCSTTRPRERLAAGARRAQAGRLLRPARLGVLGHQPRPHERRSPSAPCDGVTAARSGGCCRWSRCAPSFELSLARASRQRPRRRRRRPRAARQSRSPDRGGRERRGVPRLAGRDHRDRGGLAARAPIPLGDVPDDYPRPVAGAVERLLHNGHQRPVRARARRRAITRA